MVKNGTSVNFMVGTSKRVKHMLKQRKNKSSTNLKKENKKVFFKKKKHVFKLKCYNCGKKEHFACDSKKTKKVNGLYALVSAIDVSSSAYLIEI